MATYLAPREHNEPHAGLTVDDVADTPVYVSLLEVRPWKPASGYLMELLFTSRPKVDDTPN